MGSIYKPKYRAADGTLKESSVLWLKYRAGGRLVRQSSGTDNQGPRFGRAVTIDARRKEPTSSSPSG